MTILSAPRVAARVDGERAWAGTVRNGLAKALEGIRERCDAATDTEVLIHFTSHRIDHLDRVAWNFHRLVAHNLQAKPEVRLNQYELFVGYAACYLHDVALQATRGSTRKKLDQIGANAKRIMRNDHGRKAASWIMRTLEADAAGTVLDDVPKLGIDYNDTVAALCRYVAPVCNYHCADYPREPLPDGKLHGKRIRVDLLLRLLRLADALDLDGRRVSMERVKMQDLPADSQMHWWRHHYTDSVDISTNGLIEISMNFPRDIAAPVADFFCRETYEYIAKELRSSIIQFREAEIFPSLQPVSVGNAFGVDKKMPTNELLAYLSDQGHIAAQESQVSRVPRRPAGVRRIRAWSAEQWGILHHPFTDLPISYLAEEFVETKRLASMLSQAEAFMDASVGDLRVVFGGRGLGKTTFMESLRELARHAGKVLYLDVSVVLGEIETHEQLYLWIFRQILAEIEPHDPEQDPAITPARMRAALGRMHGRKLVVLIDNLDRYSEKPELELIRRFLTRSQGNLQALKTSALLVMSATDKWKPFLEQADLNYIGRSSFWALETFSAQEVRQLLDKRLQIAGSSYEQVFAPQAFQLIHRISKGVPRNAIDAAKLLFERAIDAQERVIDEEFIRSFYGQDLRTGISAAVLEEAGRNPQVHDALIACFGFHAAVERSSTQQRHAWSLWTRLVSQGEIPHVDVPHDIQPAFQLVATLDQQPSEGGTKMVWKVARSMGVLNSVLKAEGVTSSEFATVYSANPVKPKGTSASQIAEEFAIKRLAGKADVAFQKARALMEDAQAPATGGVEALLLARFSLEQFMVAYIHERGGTLPDSFIASHDKGFFVNHEGIRKRKSNRRLVREMFDLWDEFMRVKNERFESFREMKLIETKARDYFRRDDSPARLSGSDARLLKTAILKVGREFAAVTSKNSKRTPAG